MLTIIFNQELLPLPLLAIAGIEEPDAFYVEIIDSVTRGAKQFKAIIENLDGAKTGKYEQYRDVEITSEGVVIFKGRIESIVPKSHTGEIELMGKDYLGELMQQFIVESYVNTLTSDIVNDLVLKYAPSLTRTNIVATTRTISRTFKGVTAFDAIQELADEDGFDFWSDHIKDFHYKEKAFVSSGLNIEIGISPIFDFKFPQVGRNIINRVMVYGKVVTGVQVAVMVEDRASQSHYGVIKEHLIIDGKIETEAQAEERANAFLNEHAWVVQSGEMVVDGYETLDAGELVYIKVPDHKIDGNFLVIEKRHAVPGTTTINVAEYDVGVEGFLIDLIRRMREQEKKNIDPGAIITRILRFYEDLGVDDPMLKVFRIDINDGFVLGHEVNSELGAAVSFPLGDRTTTTQVV